MVQLIEADIQTTEVLSWRGLHVFHYVTSIASQKLRIFLRLKGLDWHSHPIDLIGGENLTPYYLGINPRGLVPAIVEDGVVHIESNDIILHLEDEHPEPCLIPADRRGEVVAHLTRENDLHLDVRTLTYRFMRDPAKPTKSREDVARYAVTGTGTVRGARDHDIDREVSFWSSYLDHGVSDEQARASAARLRAAFDDVEAALATAPYVLGDAISVVDVAWLVYAQRLTYAGYPVRELHPRVASWQAGLLERPVIAQETAMPDALREAVTARQRSLAETGQTLVDVCFPEMGRST